MTEAPLAEMSFATVLALRLLIRPAGSSGDWQEFDLGPGRFTLPQGYEACVRIKNIDDDVLNMLVNELTHCPAVVCLNLAENRKVTDAGLQRITRLSWLRELNLSSCDITDRGLVWLKELKNLGVLNLSYCNRLSEAGLKHLRALTGLTYLDLQGCPRIKHAAIIKIAARRGLTIHA
jgi:hypothetical protein